MIQIYCDGASRGNPGPSSIGVFAMKNEQEFFTISKKIGINTNNVAEWTSLLEAVNKSIELMEFSISVFMDSELVVKQMKGVYKIKNENLIQLKQKVDKSLKKIKEFQITYIPREKNKEADKLANLALDNFN